MVVIVIIVIVIFYDYCNNCCYGMVIAVVIDIVVSLAVVVTVTIVVIFTIIVITVVIVITVIIVIAIGIVIVMIKQSYGHYCELSLFKNFVVTVIAALDFHWHGQCCYIPTAATLSVSLPLS